MSVAFPKERSLHHEIEEDDEGDGAMELVQLGAERTKNVLILMSDTGGGHRASAEAIRDTFQLEFGDEYRIFVKDVWKEYTGWPLNNMERSYKFMVKHVQLWKVAFYCTSPRWIHSCYLAAIAAFYAKEVEAGLMEYKPDIIISVHPLMQHIPLWVLKRQGLQKKVVFVTVITDLNSCHPTWFHPGVNRCYCPSQEVAKRALLDGLEESQIRVFGLPIRPSFARVVISKDELREELEMDPKLPAVLLMGGGEGMGPVKKTATALGDSLFDEELGNPIGQLIIVCGRNKVLASSLESVKWKIPVKVRGFETQMQKWMGACDCIITKAGPGTIAEALIRGLPIILNDYIPGQEKGNVPYVEGNGAGIFTKSPKEAAKLVAEWFSTNTEELKRMSENALKLAQPEAVSDIVKDIHELACQRGPLGQKRVENRSTKGHNGKIRKENCARVGTEKFFAKGLFWNLTKLRRRIVLFGAVVLLLMLHQILMQLAKWQGILRDLEFERFVMSDENKNHSVPNVVFVMASCRIRHVG